MKRKYYLRGLGIGMAVTALILGIASGSTKNEGMTDEEIISRAKELGLAERTVLSETLQQDDDKKTAIPGESTPESNSYEEDVKADQQPDEAELPEPEPEEVKPSEVESTEPEIDEMSDEKQTVSVEIVRGDSSVSVSRKLKEAGLIEDDLLYDRFLCENGYDKKIQAKVYEIPIDATESEIAELISGRTGTQ